MNQLGQTEKELIAVRKQKLSELKKLGINPYPAKSDKNILASAILRDQKELIDSGKEIIAAGRILARRGHGQLAFIDLADESGKIQVILKSDLLGEEFKLSDLLDIGDFIEATGKVMITKSGEVSIEAKSVRILSKALRPLPEKRHGLQDEEIRFRKRYLELAMDPELREMFIKKAKFWQATRDFMIHKGFLEVETPTLETTAGGADANPFTTHLDALDIDVYLRISMGELWQKRLMVGGYEKTFEIGRQFRNEGISREHLQDYSQMEFYWAYANYEDSMKLVAELYKHIAKEAFGTTKFKIGDHEIDLEGEWPKIDYVSTIKEKLGIDVLVATEDELKSKIHELKIKYETGAGRGRLIDAIWKHIRKTIAGPVFLINHPVAVSPLAKRKEDNPELTERFQVILAGSEMGNGYSELNDPADQKERFVEQTKLREAGDKEAQMLDEDFVEALEYGMPPTSGFGFSERLFSFLADKAARETVIFPLMRPNDAKRQ
jgi:lysyl-tRNA synthetase class 2